MCGRCAAGYRAYTAPMQYRYRTVHVPILRYPHLNPHRIYGRIGPTLAAPRARLEYDEALVEQRGQVVDGLAAPELLRAVQDELEICVPAQGQRVERLHARTEAATVLVLQPCEFLHQRRRRGVPWGRRPHAPPSTSVCPIVPAPTAAAAAVAPFRHRRRLLPTAGCGQQVLVEAITVHVALSAPGLSGAERGQARALGDGKNLAARRRQRRRRPCPPRPAHAGLHPHAPCTRQFRPTRGGEGGGGGGRGRGGGAR
mmetsp:Transcript_92365/g.263867  ORF Transcript_92365/g.263867 Transcript_92365/m.263867 type:complete len:256 (-) Transcript_92365:745-1512(-)